MLKISAGQKKRGKNKADTNESGTAAAARENRILDGYTMAKCKALG